METDKFEKHIKAKFQEREINPSENGWSKIASELKDDDTKGGEVRINEDLVIEEIKQGKQTIKKIVNGKEITVIIASILSVPILSSRRDRFAKFNPHNQIGPAAKRGEPVASAEHWLAS